MNNGEGSSIPPEDQQVPPDAKDAANDIASGYSEFVDPETYKIDPSRIDQKLADEDMDHFVKKVDAERERQKAEMLHLLNSKIVHLRSRDEDINKRPEEGSMMEFLAQLADWVNGMKPEVKQAHLAEQSQEIRSLLTEIASNKEDYDLLIDALKTTNVEKKQVRYNDAESEVARFERNNPDDWHTYFQNTEYEALISEEQNASKDLIRARKTSEEMAPLLEMIRNNITE